MYLKKFAGILILICLFYQEIDGAKILGIFMGLGRNHYVLGKFFMLNLMEAGHDCVLISRYCDEKNNLINYKEIIVRDDNSDSLFEATQRANNNPFYAVHRIYQDSKRIVPKVFEEAQVKMLLNQTFDLVIIEEVFVDAIKVLAWHFNASLIIFHPHRANFWVNDYMGNPNLPSFISEYPSTFEVGINFLERLENVALYIHEILFKQFVYLKEHNEIREMYFPGSPDLSDIIYNTSLAFLNSDVSVHQSVPKLQSMIDIGGFHISKPTALPNEIRNFLNNSKKGVVHIDLKYLTSSYIPEETQNSIVKVFSEFEYDFLWIWDEEGIPNQPSNLKIVNSITQGAVLAHPNIKLFIHLGDTEDIIESVYYGVPQILIPVLDDQLYDTAQAQYYGYARTLPYSTLNEEGFSSALRAMLNTPKYSLETKKRSKILKEKLIPPKKAAVFWVNNVLETNGAAYMRATSLEYSWYQLYMLDVLGLFIAIFLFVNFLLVTIFVKIWRKCCTCSERKAKTKSFNSLTSIAD